MTPTLSPASACTSTAAPGRADSGAVKVMMGGVRSVVSVGAFTVTATSSTDVNAPSLAESCNTYRPAVENTTFVTAAPGDVKLTSPGPLTFVHSSVRGDVGLPSSVALPASCSGSPSVIVVSAPADTMGAVFVVSGGATTIVSSSKALRAPSLAVRRAT